jgi:cysteinyl-tRNA synthetase
MLRDHNASLQAGDTEAADRAAVLRAAGRLLGLLQHDPARWLQGGADDTTAIEEAIERRLAARKAKDFAAADRIRAELAGQGIVLEDKPGGKTEWRRA